MNNKKDSQPPHLNTQSIAQEESSCPDFLQIAINSSNKSDEMSKEESPCNVCGNHACLQRHGLSESAETDENIDGMYLVLGAVFVFLLPLLMGIIASMIATNSCFGAPAMWKSALGFVVGMVLAILLARTGILFLGKK